MYLLSFLYICIYINYVIHENLNLYICIVFTIKALKVFISSESVYDENEDTKNNNIV